MKNKINYLLLPALFSVISPVLAAPTMGNPYPNCTYQQNLFITNTLGNVGQDNNVNTSSSVSTPTNLKGFGLTVTAVRMDFYSPDFLPDPTKPCWTQYLPFSVLDTIFVAAGEGCGCPKPTINQIIITPQQTTISLPASGKATASFYAYGSNPVTLSIDPTKSIAKIVINAGVQPEFSSTTGMLKTPGTINTTVNYITK